MNQNLDMDSLKLIDAILSNKNLTEIEALTKKANLEYVYLEYTPMIAAAMKENIDAMALLMTKGANINQTNNDSQTALHYAFRYNKIKSAKFLLNLKEIKKDLKDAYGTRPIDWAKYCNYKELIKLYNHAKNKNEELNK